VWFPPEEPLGAPNFKWASSPCFSPKWQPGQQSQLQKISDFYGLYYAYENNEDTEFAALVFSSDGTPIPPRANDEDAPTQPGLHIGQKRFAFAWSHFPQKRFSFRTARIGDTEYAFRGRFGREDVDIIFGVPYLAGVLTERRNGRVLLRKKVHFGHAVIL
jgi:hypothetical protein